MSPVLAAVSKAIYVILKYLVEMETPILTKKKISLVGKKYTPTFSIFIPEWEGRGDEYG